METKHPTTPNVHFPKSNTRIKRFWNRQLRFPGGTQNVGDEEVGAVSVCHGVGNAGAKCWKYAVEMRAKSSRRNRVSNSKCTTLT